MLIRIPVTGVFLAGLMNGAVKISRALSVRLLTAFPGIAG
jgi:hypothetical protein